MWNCEGWRGPGWAEATSGHSQLLGNFDCGVGELHYKRPPSVLNSVAAQKRWALQFLPQQHSPLTPPQDWHGLVGRSCWSHFLKMQSLCWNALYLHTLTDILSVSGWNAEQTCALMETQWPLISISESLKTFLNVRFSIFCFLLDSQSSETSSLEVAFSNGLLCVLCCAFFCPSLVVAHGTGLPGNI